jgi:hypothetical protein
MRFGIRTGGYNGGCLIKPVEARVRSMYRGSSDIIDLEAYYTVIWCHTKSHQGYANKWVDIIIWFRDVDCQRPNGWCRWSVSDCESFTFPPPLVQTKCRNGFREKKKKSGKPTADTGIYYIQRGKYTPGNLNPQKSCCHNRILINL